jgi:DNA-binding NarL/FixJ family response regulator
MNIRITITDDHPMIIGGIRDMLSNYTHITLTGTYTSGEALLTGLETDIPDILLLDIQLPGQNGDELVPILKKNYPDLGIIILTNFNSIVYTHNMIRLGVKGYLLKTADEATIMEAIHTVHKGDSFIEPSLQEKLGSVIQKTRNPLISKMRLTLREKEILRMIVKGHTNQEIVSTLFLSINTVKTYRKRIFLKLDVKNMAELTSKALSMGLME